MAERVNKAQAYEVHKGAWSRWRERRECDERVLGSSEFLHQALTRLSAEPLQARDHVDVSVARLCQRVAAYFDVSEREIASPSLRRQVLAPRAVLCHLAVCHHGVSLSGVGRRLSISRTSIARAVQRAPVVYTAHGCKPDDFLTG